jgi:hypothetical protein
MTKKLFLRGGFGFLLDLSVESLADFSLEFVCVKSPLDADRRLEEVISFESGPGDFEVHVVEAVVFTVVVDGFPDVSVTC